jgi:hypothetical protein
MMRLQLAPVRGGWIYPFALLIKLFVRKYTLQDLNFVALLYAIDFFAFFTPPHKLCENFFANLKPVRTFAWD